MGNGSHKVLVLECSAWIRWVCLPACLQCGKVWETTSSSLSNKWEQVSRALTRGSHVQKLHLTSHFVTSSYFVPTHSRTGSRAWIFYVLSWPWNASPVVDQLHSQSWCDGFWRRALTVRIWQAQIVNIMNRWYSLPTCANGQRSNNKYITLYSNILASDMELYRRQLWIV